MQFGDFAILRRGPSGQGRLRSISTVHRRKARAPRCGLCV